MVAEQCHWVKCCCCGRISHQVSWINGWYKAVDKNPKKQLRDPDGREQGRWTVSACSVCMVYGCQASCRLPSAVDCIYASNVEKELFFIKLFHWLCRVFCTINEKMQFLRCVVTSVGRRLGISLSGEPFWIGVLTDKTGEDYLSLS